MANGMRRTVLALIVAGASIVGVSAPATASLPPDLDPDLQARLERVAERTEHPACRFGWIARIVLDDRCGDRSAQRVGATTHPGTSDLAEQAVMDQQRHLNDLFEGYGIAELAVDGDPGAVTRQRLCAFRLAVGLPVSTDDMETGSEEEAVLFATDELPIPDTAATSTERWILIDRQCQMMFVGAGDDHLQFVFPTSTGKNPFPTRTQDRTPAYRYNPASHNGGWHNSLTYPAADDNPLNGNMYRPLYFDGGQAIHGANSVPRSPASHGCARLRVWHQDELLEWLDLAGSGATHSRSRINVTVTVQGSWQG